MSGSRPRARARQRQADLAGRRQASDRDPSSRVGEEAAGRAVEGRRPGRQRHDPVGQQHLVHLLGHEHDREAVVGLAATARQHLVAPRRIEHRRGLVEHEHAARHGQHPGQRGALALTTRQQVGLARAQVRRPNCARTSSTRRAISAEGRAEVLETKGQVFFDGGAHELVLGILEQHADVAAHGKVARRRSSRSCPHTSRARPRRPLQPAQQPGERRLAGAVGADHGHELALVNGRSTPRRASSAAPRVAEVQAAMSMSGRTLTPRQPAARHARGATCAAGTAKGAGAPAAPPPLTPASLPTPARLDQSRYTISQASPGRGPSLMMRV